MEPAEMWIHISAGSSIFVGGLRPVAVQDR
jgi:hypothetical protein